ncbi:MAG: monooxygenase [Zoogloeaceae bacterium]|jgi:hypothetical protein|nr:monooxygenase [Zoogloeaceae bacterium]
MSVILQVDFPYSGPWGQGMTDAMDGLARSIADEPGLVWKIWTANESAREAGGIYLFTDRPSAESYLSMHRARLEGFGVSNANAKIFDVNEALSKMDRAPIPDIPSN